MAKTYCGAWTAAARLEDGTWVAVPITCRAWDCRRCAPRNKARLLRRLEYSKPNLFATLTTSPRTAPTPEQAYFRANAAISQLVKRWRRRFPADAVEYFLVWERTKAGWPHAHLLLRAPKVSKHWLSHTWLELTGSYVTDLQPVHSQAAAARYLSKYLAKDPQVPPGQRRWRRSAKFFDTAAEPPRRLLPTITPWTRIPRRSDAQALHYLIDGLAVTIDQDGVVRARDDPDAWLHQVDGGFMQALERQVLPWERPDLIAYRLLAEKLRRARRS